MRKIVAVAFAAGALFAGQAMAQEYGKTYIGLGVGTTELKTNINLAGGGGGGRDYKGDAATYSGILGYAFNEYISLEGVFTITGKASDEGWAPCSEYNVDADFGYQYCDLGSPLNPQDPVIPGEAGIQGSTDMRSFELAAKGTLPFGKFELFGRAGWGFGDFGYDYRLYVPDTQYTGEPCIGGVGDPNGCAGRDNITGNRIVTSFQDSGLVLGLGIGWNFGRGAIRLQYDYIGIETNDTTEFLITGTDGGSPSTDSYDLTFKTDNPNRLMLSFSGRL